MTRYFLVFWDGTYNNGKASGVSAVEWDNGFPPRLELEAKFRQMGTQNVVFRNILEVSKQDFKDWNK